MTSSRFDYGLRGSQPMLSHDIVIAGEDAVGFAAFMGPEWAALPAKLEKAV